MLEAQWARWLALLRSTRYTLRADMKPISLRGARTHHLAGIDIDVRPGELLVLTGVSGSGKSTLAFDTLYAEGQRRFVESFSPYARQFLERLARPPMDRLEPVAAGVAVDRRAPVKSSRSTVATMADLEAYLSALFVREALPRCPDCDRVASYTDPGEVAARISAEHAGKRSVISYPKRVAGTEDFLELREELIRDGYRRLWLEGKTRDLDAVAPSEVLAGGAALQVVVDRLKLGKGNKRRARQAVESAWIRGEGQAKLHVVDGEESPAFSLSRGLACGGCDRVFRRPASGLFSYQSPVGACPSCRGFGRTLGIDYHKVIPDTSKSLAKGAIKAWSGKRAVRERRRLKQFCEEQGIDRTLPWKELSEEHQQAILLGEGTWSRRRYGGLPAWFRMLEGKLYKMHVRVFLSRYRSYERCEDCDGKRLSNESLMYEVAGRDLGSWHQLEIREARRALAAMELRTEQGRVARDILVSRIGYLEAVGLGYLSLDRQARTLSGGEAQRVSLTAALGSSLTGAMFVLDEPTVGLHGNDIPPLVKALHNLARRGNAVIVIEHDPEVIRHADRIVELGPGAGPAGGKIVFDGTPAQARRRKSLATAQSLAPLRLASSSVKASPEWLHLKGVEANNLQAVDVSFPLQRITAVCGLSGSGKSSLVDTVLARALARHCGDFSGELPGPFKELLGASNVRSVQLCNQAPLGRSSRGNPATYSGAWTRIRTLLAQQPLSEMNEFGPGYFSFNVSGGRCDACKGEGAETVEMQFLADVRLGCVVCGGARFRQEVLAVQLHGKSVADWLNTSVEECAQLLRDEAAVQRSLRPLLQLGLAYLPLGQPLSTLSGGEAQRLKLARALSEVKKGSFYVLDEPSAGLHASEVAYVNSAMRSLVDAGATVVVVDHDPAIVAAGDWVIEMGPGAGQHGGRVVAACTPQDLLAETTATAELLRRAMDASHRSKSPRRPRIKALSQIEVTGARENNLANISLAVPHAQLSVVTGPSGSGKSSLAFDVIFAEGQRRFVETLTPYARQFLPMLPRPAVDRVEGVLPSIALEQRRTVAAVGSTVATLTEIAHYLRLLFAKLGTAHCPDCDLPLQAISADALYEKLHAKRGSMVLRAPVVRARKGSYLEVFEAAAAAGLETAWVDGKRCAVDPPPRLNKRKEHTIELVTYEGSAKKLPRKLLEQALRSAQGQVVVAAKPGQKGTLYATRRVCPDCDRAVDDLDPRWFSFNTRQGRCGLCEGSGVLGGYEVLREAMRGSDSAMQTEACPACDGARLSALPRGVRLFGERYHMLCRRSVRSALAHCLTFHFEGDAARIAEAPLQELLRRLRFVEQVGLGYLSLDRPARTLSGGELQRLRLAAQLGSGLTGALYVLDEPTIGLHPRDTQRLLDNLRALVDTGSTVVVVEHDADTIAAADYLVDMGPRGGRAGGRVVASGAAAQVLSNPASPTAAALAEAAMPMEPARTREKDHGEVRLLGARANNLRGDELRLPAGRLCVVAGVSGSGKSSLVGQVLLPAARQRLGLTAGPAGLHDTISLPSSVQRVIAVNQQPIGRTPRSVPATFLKIWDPIRRLFAGTPDARALGFTATRFSFNSTQGGRCETCGGMGVISHEMSFLPNVKTTCSSCEGLRFEASTLDIRYRGLSIGEVLRLTVREGCEFFAAHRKIRVPLETLCELGVDYLQIGQGSATLSGGEAQRLKLASELSAGRGHKPTMYVLDEPTTGLHQSDVMRLIAVLQKLVERGDTLVVIEHHPSVIAAADHVVELGPEGGAEGGRIVAACTPRELAKTATATGQVLASMFAR